MPPITQQGSRGALITWSVVCAFLFLICLVFAIFFYVQASEAEERLATLESKYREVVPEAALTRPDIAEIRAMRGQEGSGLTQNMSVLDAVIKQRNDLAQMIAGAGADPMAAQTAAREVLNTASQNLQTVGAEVNVSPSDSLAVALQTLATGLQNQIQQVNTLQASLDETQTQLRDTRTEMQNSLAAMDQQVQQIRQQAQQEMEALTSYRQGKDQSVAQIEQARAEERRAAEEAQQIAQTQIRELEAQVESLTSDLDAVRTRYEGWRLNTSDPVIRQPDGQIVRVPQQGVVYVSLGQRDSITPGLTFEVYDAQQGIPSLASDDSEALPVGKASIEITRVGATTSEARVTRQEPGQVITEGDPIVNLVYDPNTSYNFMVYGNFDLDQNGVATPQDTEVIRRLITQWGGELTDQVNVNTDFVVLGQEPVLPSFTREELQDPINVRRLADAQDQLDQYLAIRDRAAQLRIPILNQNRFLYLVGYYNQATR